MSGATERIAEFIVHTPSKDIPKGAMDVARDATLDCVGVILAASREPIGRIVTDYVRGLGAAPRSGVFGGGFKSSPQDAAFANGVMGHAMDYDDMHTGCAGHPSVALVPAILALGEALRASGEEVLAAYTIGFEVIYRIGQEVGLKFLGNGYHPTGVWAPVGAAAAAARLLKLDPLKTRWALGIAASEAGGIVGNFGTMTKPFHAGNGARGGVTAAVLAQGGFTAAIDIFESEKGFLRVPSHSNDFDLERFTRNLGRDYALSQGIGIKLYPSCGKTHCSIDSTLQLVQRYDIRPDDVAEVVCVASDTVPKDSLIYHRPKNGLEGKFSMEYCVAAALLDRAVGLKQFADEAVLRPQARAVMEKFRYEHPQELMGQGGFLKPEKIKLRLRDGREVSHQVDRAPGDLGRPVTEEELAAKYRDCASVALEPEAVERSLGLLQRLGQLHDVAELAEAVSAMPKGARQPSRR